MADKNEPKFELRNFDGTVEKAEEFFRNFKLCADKFKWTTVADGEPNPPAYFHMAVRLTKIASVWWDQLPNDRKNTYNKICTEFETKWIKGESFLLLNEKFESLKLGDKDLDEFHMELVHLGNKLGASDDTVASRFLNSLPPQMKTFTLTSDIHSVEAYIKKCRLFKTTQKAPPIVNAIQGQNQQVEDGYDFFYGEQTADPTCAIPGASQNRGRYRARGYRGSQNFRGTRGSYQQNRGASNTQQRGASRYNKSARSQGSRGKGNQNSTRGVCHGCKMPGHYIRDCKFDPKKGLDTCSKCHLPTHQTKNCPF